MLVALIMVSHHIGATARRSMVGSVEFALKQVFTQANELTIQPTGLTNKSVIATLVIEPARLSMLQYYTVDGDSRVFPSFVAQSNVFLTTESVHVPSHDILCVVQMPDGSLHGIDGSGVCSNVSTQQFSRWHHRPLADAKN